MNQGCHIEIVQPGSREQALIPVQLWEKLVVKPGQITAVAGVWTANLTNTNQY